MKAASLTDKTTNRCVFRLRKPLVCASMIDGESEAVCGARRAWQDRCTGKRVFLVSSVAYHRWVVLQFIGCRTVLGMPRLARRACW